MRIIERVNDLEGMTITPPVKPLERVTTIDMCYIFGLSKTTLFRWEKDGIIPSPKRDLAQMNLSRMYGWREVVAVMKEMKKQRETNPNMHPWLEGVNLEEPFECKLPSGYTVSINPEFQSPHPVWKRNKNAD